MKFLKAAVILLLLFYFLHLATQAYPETPLWFVDTLMHEAGHWLFWIFGNFMSALGGSLNQILVPLLFFGYFLFKKELYSAAIVLFWVGENFLAVAAYAHDAIAMQLPLLGGDASTHDWNWLLITAGQLHHTYGIAAVIKIVGILCILLAGFAGFYAVFTTPDTKENSI